MGERWAPTKSADAMITGVGLAEAHKQARAALELLSNFTTPPGAAVLFDLARQIRFRSAAALPDADLPPTRTALEAMLRELCAILHLITEASLGRGLDVPACLILQPGAVVRAAGDIVDSVLGDTVQAARSYS